MIDSQSFRKLFPFGFALDTDLKITFCSRSLDRLIPYSEGLEFSERFSLQRQTGQATADTIAALFDRPVQLDVEGEERKQPSQEHHSAVSEVPGLVFGHLPDTL